MAAAGLVSTKARCAAWANSSPGTAWSPFLWIIVCWKGDDVRRFLRELAEVRNVVAHSNGKADLRFVERCPWFGALAGKSICVTQKHFRRYVIGSRWYLVELSRRISTMYSLLNNRAVETSKELDALARLEKSLIEIERNDDSLALRAEEGADSGLAAQSL